MKRKVEKKKKKMGVEGQKFKQPKKEVTSRQKPPK